MPAAGTRARGPQFKRNSPDTAVTLRFIHVQTEQGIPPDKATFLRSGEGVRLVNHYGAGSEKQGKKKVTYNFDQTLQRYEQWRNGAGMSTYEQLRKAAMLFFWKLITPRHLQPLPPLPGDFTTQQLELAGLALPERNADRVAGRNIEPGTDSEGEDLARRAAEDDYELGREDDNVEEPEREEQASEQEEQENENPFVVDNQVNCKMTYLKRLIAIPGFDEGTDSKTMYMAMVALPGGVDTAIATMDNDKNGLTMSWNELGQAFNPAFLLAGMLQMPGNGHILAHVRDNVENEILADPNLQRVNGGLLRSTHFSFDETSEPFLFNPFTREQANPVHIVRATGGLSVAITACFRQRTTAIQAPIADTELSLQEQMQRAAGYFPGLRDRLNQMNFNHFQAPQVAHQAPPPQMVPQPPQVQIPQAQALPVAAAGDQALMQTLLQRLQQTENQANERIRQIEQEQLQQRTQFQQTTDQIHNQYRNALAAQRTELEQRVAGATPAMLQVLQRMSPNTFRRYTPEQLTHIIGQAVREQAANANTAGPAVGPEVVTVGSSSSSASSMTGMTHGGNGGAGAA